MNCIICIIYLKITNYIDECASILGGIIIMALVFGLLFLKL